MPHRGISLTGTRIEFPAYTFFLLVGLPCRMKTQCQCHSKGPAPHPKEEVPEGTSSESKMIEGDGKMHNDPTSLLSSENALPSSARDSFSSALESFFY